jgi:cell division protein FtsX
MRFADMLRMSLSALWQQKVRTFLTIAGIAIGAVVLAVTLSIQEGFEEEVKRQLRHGDQLRQIWVFPDKKVRLTEATVATLRGLPHVESVTPMGSHVCDVCLSRDLLPRPEQVATTVGLAALTQGLSPLGALPHLMPGTRQAIVFVARPNDEHLRDRLIAGTYLSSADAKEVLVAKNLVKELALSRGESAEWLVGQKLGVVYPSLQRNNMEMRRLLQVVDQVLPPSESEVVRKVLTQLWKTGNRTILTADEREVLNKALWRELDAPAVAREMVAPGKDKVLPAPDTLVTRINEEERTVLAKLRKEIEGAHEELKLTDANKEALDKVLRRYLGDPQTLGPGQAPFHEELIIVGVLRDYAREEENLGLQLAAQTDRVDLFLSGATSERLLRTIPEFKELGYHGVFITVDAEENLKEVIAEVKNLGLAEHSLVEFAERLVAGLKMERFLISFLAIMGGLAAALGIINIMAMSVLERTREIGVMKAVGARDRHIQMIFLVEGGVLGLLGGGLGVLGAWLASFPGDAYARQLAAEFSYLRQLRHSLFVFPWWLVLGVPSFACTVTTLAAVVPARRAAKVNPIEALRHE